MKPFVVATKLLQLLHTYPFNNGFLRTLFLPFVHDALRLTDEYLNLLYL